MEQFEDAIPLFEDLVDTIVIPENDGGNDDRESQDDQGDPIAGEFDAGEEYAAYHGTYEDDDGEAYELVWFVECQTLEDGESVAVFSLFTSEANYEDEVDLAQEVIASLES